MDREYVGTPKGKFRIGRKLKFMQIHGQIIILLMLLILGSQTCSPPIPVYEEGHLYVQYGCTSFCDSERSKREDLCFLIILQLKSTDDKNISPEELSVRKKYNENSLASYAYCMLQASDLPGWPRDKIF